jgi:hypothetical protein
MFGWECSNELKELSPEQIPRGRSREMTGNLSYVPKQKDDSD